MVNNLNDAELHSRVKEIVRNVVYRSASLTDITASTKMQDLDVDSARLVDLVLTVEDEFAIHIEDDVIDSIKTVGDLVDVIKQKAAA